MSLITLPSTLTGGTIAKAADVMGDFQAITAVVNGELDQSNFQNMTGALTWAITANNNALSISDAGNIETISITKSTGAAAGHSIFLLSATAAQTAGDAGLNVQFTSVSSTISLARFANSGTGNSIDVNSSGVLAAGKRLVSIVSSAAQTSGDAGLYAELSSASTTIPVALFKASGTGGAATFSNSGSGIGVTINDTGTPSAGEAALLVSSTTKGVRLPSMTTTQRNAIASPVEGTELYNNSLHRKEVYDGLAWSGVGSRLNTVAKTANYTAATSDDLILCDATAGSFVITMPARASAVAGKVFTVQKTDSSANTIPVKDNGGSTITTLSLQTEYCDLLTDGSTWYVVRQMATASHLSLPNKTQLPSVGQQVSSSSGGFSTSSTLYVSVTNLSVTLTTSGRPVMIRLQADGQNLDTSLLEVVVPGGTNFGLITIALFRDSSAIASFPLYIQASSSGTNLDLQVPVSIINHLDVPSAGSHTYEVKMKVNAAPITGRVSFAVLAAFEL